MNITNASVLTQFAYYGIKFEKDVIDRERCTIYISVPEHSEIINSCGIEMAGQMMGVICKDTLAEFCGLKLPIKCKVRKGEFWTKKIGEEAKETARKEYFNL